MKDANQYFLRRFLDPDSVAIVGGSQIQQEDLIFKICQRETGLYVTAGIHQGKQVIPYLVMDCLVSVFF